MSTICMQDSKRFLEGAQIGFVYFYFGGVFRKLRYDNVACKVCSIQIGKDSEQNATRNPQMHRLAQD